MNEGFIMLHRKILNWEWNTDPNTFNVFVHLLLMANHSENKWKGMEIQRGQVITSVSSLSKITGLSTKNIRTSLNHLKSTNEVAIVTTSQYSMITICKYDCYQSDVSRNGKRSGKQNGNQVANDWQTGGKRVATNNNDNNDKKENNDNKLGKLKFAPPTLEEIKIYIESEGLPKVGDAFYYYYQSIGWKVGKNPMKDWRSSLRLWASKNPVTKNTDNVILHNNNTDKFKKEDLW